MTLLSILILNNRFALYIVTKGSLYKGVIHSFVTSSSLGSWIIQKIAGAIIIFCNKYERTVSSYVNKIRVELPLLSVVWSPSVSSVTMVMEIRSYFLLPLASMTT